MPMRGNFLAAKKMALALESLIRTQFPRDALYIVGFSDYARELKSEMLAQITWNELPPSKLGGILRLRLFEHA
jgi:uncharacterized protein with von Willebrand factor type A (vWA) domain